MLSRYNIIQMWKSNQLEDAIPQSSSSREAGGISIPPLHFDSGRQSHQGRQSQQSSTSSSISLDKLKLFYTQKMSEIRQIIQEQTVQHQERRVDAMNSILVKSSFSKEEVKEIVLMKDVEIDQMLEEFYEARIMDEESKLNLVSTFSQSITVTDLIQIINDLIKRLTQHSNKTSFRDKEPLKEKAINQKEEGKYSRYQFDTTIDTLNTENDIVAEKLRCIIEKRRGLRGKSVSKKSPIKEAAEMANQRIPTFTNLNSLSVGDHQQSQESVLGKIFAEIKKIRAEISSINSKMDKSSLTDKTVGVLEKEYLKAIDKVEILEHEIEHLSKELNYTHNSILNQEKKNLSTSANEIEYELSRAMQKIVRLQQHLNQATDNFNRETEKLQERIDSKDKKIRQLTEAINTMNMITNEKEGEFEDTISNSVDKLMEEIDRLNGELAKSDLEIKGYQLQIMRMSKVIEDKDQKIQGGEEMNYQEESEVQDSELVREIQRKCEDMASENQKVIENLDREKEAKEQRLKHIYHMAAQKSSRTNRSRQRDREGSYSGYESRVRNNRGEMDEGFLIEDLNNKIHRKIEQLKIEREKNHYLDSENLELKEEILLLRAKFSDLEGIEQVPRDRRESRINSIAQIIDSYEYGQKAQMIDCFSLLIKILSDHVKDPSIINRCEDLLRCAESSRDQSSNEAIDQRYLQKSPIFSLDKEIRREEREDKGKVDSVPTLIYKKQGAGTGNGTGSGNGKNGKSDKRRPVS